MSIIEDIPFDGDTSQPLPETLKKARKAQIEYSLALLEQDEYQVSDEQKLIDRFITEGPIKIDPIEQALQAELNTVKLEVEIEAIRKRAADKQKQRDNILAVYRSVDLMANHNIDSVLKRPIKQFANTRDLAHYKRIFSELGSEKLSINQMADLIEPCDWLAQEVIKLANSGSTRKALGLSGVAEAQDIKQAVNIISVKNTTLLIPELIYKNAAKEHGGLALEMWQRMLRFYQLSAIAAYKLAASFGLNAEHIYMATALSGFAKLTWLNLYCAEGKRARLSSLEKARGLRDDFRVSVLDEYQPGAEHVVKLFAFAPSLLDVVIDTLNCHHMPLMDILNAEEGAEDANMVMLRAQGYVAYRLLTSAKLLQAEQANDFLKAFKMDQQSLSILQQLSLNQLNVFNLDN